MTEAPSPDLPRLLELLAATRDMRRLQRAWFGGDKSRETLAAARAAERRVDLILRAIDTVPLQGSLFK